MGVGYGNNEGSHKKLGGINGNVGKEIRKSMTEECLELQRGQEILSKNRYRKVHVGMIRCVKYIKTHK